MSRSLRKLSNFVAVTGGAWWLAISSGYHSLRKMLWTKDIAVLGVTFTKIQTSGNLLKQPNGKATICYHLGRRAYNIIAIPCCRGEYNWMHRPRHRFRGLVNRLAYSARCNQLLSLLWKSRPAVLLTQSLISSSCFRMNFMGNKKSPC